jgi:uncharacterized integral membrane protein
MNATLRSFVIWVIIVLLLLVVFTLYQPLADRLFIGAGASSQAGIGEILAAMAGFLCAMAVYELRAKNWGHAGLYAFVAGATAISVAARHF